MLNTISATTADTAGHIALDVLDDNTDGDVGRRVARIATLDGGAVVTDAGYTDADRTIELAWVPRTASFEASVSRMVQSYSRVHVSTRSGFFLAAPEIYRPGAEESVLRLLVLEKLSA